MWCRAMYVSYVNASNHVRAIVTCEYKWMDNVFECVCVKCGLKSSSFTELWFYRYIEKYLCRDPSVSVSSYLCNVEFDCLFYLAFVVLAFFVGI